MNKLFQKAVVWFRDMNTKQFSYEKEGIRPTRDWNLIISCFFVTAIFIAGLSFYIYKQVDSGRWFVAPVDQSLTDAKINEVLLEKTIKKIDGNKKIFDEVKNGGSKLSDPSI